MIRALSLIIVWILFNVSIIFSESGDTLWTRTYGGSCYDEARFVQQTMDDGFVVTGFTRSFGPGGEDICLLKTNSNGDTLWAKAYGGSLNDRAYCALQTVDGGYIIAGRTMSFGAGIWDVYIVKTDFDGDTLWTRTYGGSDNDGARFVQQTIDDGYIVVGYTCSFGTDSKDIWLLKLNSSGDTLWSRTYGGMEIDHGHTVEQLASDGFIVAGYTYSFGCGHADLYLVKTDFNGDTLWTRTYGGSSYEEGYSIKRTSDGAYIVSGGTYSSIVDSRMQALLLKINDNGDTLWSRRYGETDKNEFGMSVQQTIDGGYIFAGSSGIVDWRNRITGDLYVVKTDSLGYTQWIRTYGGNDGDRARSIELTTDGGYIIAGITGHDSLGDSDFWLLKLSAEHSDIKEPDIELHNLRFNLKSNYPNPFNTTTNIIFYLPGESRIDIEVFNLMGQKVATLVDGYMPAGSHTVSWDATSVSSGIYFYKLTTGDEVLTKRMTLLK